LKNTPLIFDWPIRHRIHLLLSAMLVLAALAHGSIFFLFTIAYPKGKADTLKSAQVFFLPEGSPQKLQIEGLLLSSDPSLFAPGRGMPREEGVFSSTYTPQFASEKNTLLPIPPRWEAQPPAHVPSVRREFKFPTLATPKQETPALAAKLQSGPALADRLPSLPENPVVPLLASGSLDALTFLIGVDSSGNVAFLVPERSSGDPSIDRDLIQLLRSLRFAPSEKSGIAWDFLEFHWGSRPQKTP